MSDLQNKTHFTPTELKVIHYLSLGYANKEIAEALNVGVKNVALRISNISRLAGCTHRRLVRWCVLYELVREAKTRILPDMLNPTFFSINYELE